MECFPCSPQVFFPLHVQSIWLEQVFEPVLRAWKNPRNIPRLTSQPSKSSKHTAWSSLLSSLELLSNLSVVVVIAFAHCNNIKKKGMEKGEPFLFDLRDSQTCFRFMYQKICLCWMKFSPINPLEKPGCDFLQCDLFTWGKWNLT